MSQASWAVESSQDFVKDASVGNEFEVQSSRLALQKSQNDEIKKFAQQMVMDHTKAAEALKASLSSAPDADVEMPSGHKLDRTHSKLLQKLSQASGADFDKLYVKDQLKAHNDAVYLFKSYSEDGDNPQIKDFATQTLPTLQEHQQYITKIKLSM
jgi:putative membrane protein